SPCAGPFAGREGAIVAVVPAVAPELAADGATVASQHARDLGLAVMLTPQAGDRVSFCRGELGVRQESLPFPRRRGSSDVTQLASTLLARRAPPAVVAPRL